MELRTKNDVEGFVCFINGVLMLEISSGAELEKKPQPISYRFDQPQRHGWKSLVNNRGISKFSGAKFLSKLIQNPKYKIGDVQIHQI